MMDAQKIKDEIKMILDKYDRIKERGELDKYNEEMTKKDFILPLFRALGWYTEDSSEVIAEEVISKKRVDYSFRINGIPIFFLEAKSLKEDLDNPKFIEQSISYSWHRGCTWAILTNFELIKVFNAEWKTKGISESLFFEIKYTEYLKNFDQLYLLSKQAISEGLLDREAEKWGKKLKRQQISDQILDDLLKARRNLTKNIIEHPRINKISELELDEAVQRLLDRLIFIRTCEDRNIEQNHLLAAVRNKSSKSLWDALKDIFRRFDRLYNSKLFEEHFCDQIVVDDYILEEIINSLYYTNTGNIYYDFSAINADVLGSIYEQYLGHILKKTTKSTNIKETHQHRRKQGIYYTPTYIVDYIVKNTIAYKLRNSKPKDAMNLRILDPSCGSGSFLIRAFDELVDYWHNVSPSKFSYFLKIEILKNNIFGVDLDKQAVEITQMNLLLKTIQHYQRLPVLKNIKQGNSLIDDPLVVGENAFKWEEEFEDVMNEGGFDVIIGNPPYNAELSDDEKSYMKKNYKELLSGDSAEYFIGKVSKLLKKNGILGFIVPKSMAYYEKWSGIRKLLLGKFEILNIADVGLGVPDANLEEVIIIAKNRKHNKEYNVQVDQFSNLKRSVTNKIIVKSDLLRSSLMKSNGILIFTPLSDIEQGILWKINEKSIRFSEIIEESFRGIYISDKDKELLRKGNIKFIMKEPWIQRYNIRNYVSIGIDENFIDKAKVERILNKKLIFKVLRGKRLTVFYDEEGEYLTTSNIVNVKLKANNYYDAKFLCGLFNSSLLSFYVQKSLFSDTTESARHLDGSYLSIFPIPKEIDQKYRDLVKIVDDMLILNYSLNKIGDKKTDERRKIEEEIQKTDDVIDDLVYKIYGINDKEKKIIEESLK